MKNRTAAANGRRRPERILALTTEEAVEQLDEALRAVGIILPSLGIDPVTGASDQPFPLVRLGCCNMTVAAWLAAVLREAAET